MACYTNPLRPLQGLVTSTIVMLLSLVFLAPQATQAGLLGVDVSKWQGDVNWTAIKQDGISFGFAKATEGVNFVDSKFHTNMTNARLAGVPIGPYHFARPDSSVGNLADPVKQDAINEANDFVDAIQPYYDAYPGSYLRPVLDTEKTPETAEINTLSEKRQYLSDWTRDFNSVVQSRLGLDVIIYSGGWRSNNLYEQDISSYDLWFAKPTNDLNSQPSAANIGIWSEWKFWQWTWEATYGGLSAVDANYFDGDLNDLQAYIVGGSLEGDYNDDGTVNAADYTLWRDTWLSLGQNLPADGDNDGFVGNTDYTVWTSHFGETNVAISSAIPEPATWLLMGLGLAALASRRKAT